MRIICFELYTLCIETPSHIVVIKINGIFNGQFIILKY